MTITAGTLRVPAKPFPANMKINVFSIRKEGRNEVFISDKDTIAGRKPVLTGTDLKAVTDLLTDALQAPCAMYIDESLARMKELRDFETSDNVQLIGIRNDLDEKAYIPGPKESDKIFEFNSGPRKRLFEIMQSNKGIMIGQRNCDKDMFQTIAEGIDEFIQKNAGENNTTVNAVMAGAAASFVRHVDPETYKRLYDMSPHRETGNPKPAPIIIPLKGSGMKS